MAYYINQGRGGNLALRIESAGRGPYGVMTVYLPVTMLFGFEPLPGSSSPALEGSPEWTDAEQSRFQEAVSRVVGDAWSRKFPLYGSRDARRDTSANARSIGFDSYQTAKVDVEVEVEVRCIDQEGTAPCQGGLCVANGSQNVNLIAVLRVPAPPARKRFRSSFSDSTRAGFLYQDDTTPSPHHGFSQITAAHEAGHLLGFDHIGMNEPGCTFDPSGRTLLMANRGNNEVCYQQGGMWSDNIMGVGMRHDQNQYGLFAGLLSRIMPEFNWRAETYGSRIPLGSAPVPVGGGGCGFRP